MKKFLLLPLILGVVLIPAAAYGTKPDDNGFHKVTICHNVSHNPHAISIDVAAVAGSQETKHGLLTLDAELHFVSFVPHNSGGHDQDFFLHIGKENKPEDDERCAPQETTTTTAPPTTTTTAPPVTTTTVPPVTTTTGAPSVVTTTSAPKPTAVPSTPAAPAQPTAPSGSNPAAPTSLPHTGGGGFLAGIGAGLTGIGQMMRRVFRRKSA